MQTPPYGMPGYPQTPQTPLGDSSARSPLTSSGEKGHTITSSASCGPVNISSRGSFRVQEGLNLYVSQLPPTVNSTRLRDVFSRFGPIHSAKVMHDQNTNESRCFGFVLFERSADGERAMSEMNGMYLEEGNGRLHVRVARPTALPQPLRDDASTESNNQTPTNLPAKQSPMMMHDPRTSRPGSIVSPTTPNAPNALGHLIAAQNQMHHMHQHHAQHHFASATPFRPPAGHTTKTDNSNMSHTFFGNTNPYGMVPSSPMAHPAAYMTALAPSQVGFSTAGGHNVLMSQHSQPQGVYVFSQPFAPPPAVPMPYMPTTHASIEQPSSIPQTYFYPAGMQNPDDTPR